MEIIYQIKLVGNDGPAFTMWESSDKTMAEQKLIFYQRKHPMEDFEIFTMCR